MRRKVNLIGALACALVLLGGQAWGAYIVNFMPGGGGIGDISGGDDNPTISGSDTFGYGNRDENRTITTNPPGGPPSGTTVTTSAWTLRSDGTWDKSQLYGWNGGLGICDTTEGWAPTLGSCNGTGEHSADNENGQDFFLLEFTNNGAGVEVSGATVTAWGNGASNTFFDYDASYFQGQGPINLMTTTNGVAGLGLQRNATNDAATDHNPNTFSLTGIPGADWLLIGASLGQGDVDDGFKLKSVQFTAIPIPDSALLFGTGLLGFIVLARRKNFIKKS